MVNEQQRPSGYLKIEFINRHPELEDIVESEIITDYLDDCPVHVVEYKGTLVDETKKQRKNRMQCHKVYDGDIKELVNGLRNTYAHKRNLSAYGLLLEVYESIRSIQSLDLEKARQQVASKSGVEDIKQDEVEKATDGVVTDNNVVLPEKRVETPTPVKQADESVKIDSPVEPAEVKEQVTEEVTKHEVEVKEHSTDEKLNIGISGESETKDTKEEVKTPTPTAEEVTPIEVPNVETSNPKRIQENLKANKEEKKMANIDVEQMVKQATDKMAGGQVTGGTTALPKATDVNPEITESVINQLASTAAQRNAWTQNNEVSALIMAQQPAALRLVGAPEGPVVRPGKDEDPQKLIDEKLAAFIEAVSGKAMSINEFATLPDDQKFANCVDDENKAKAAAMFSIYQNLHNNPQAIIKAYVDPSKASAPVKGYFIGNEALPVEELIVKLLDEGNGVVYGQGTKALEDDKQVFFKLNFASRRQSQVTAGASKSGAPKQIVITAKNKKSFLENDAHKRYLMTQIDKDGESRANFKAEVVVDGKAMNAVCSVWALKDGQKIGNGTAKDGTPKFKKKICSINVSVPVQKVLKEVDAAYRGDNDQPAVLEKRWNIKIAQAECKDFGNITDQRSSLTFAALTKMLSGQVGASDSILKNSKLYRDLSAAAEKSQAADEAATAGDLQA